MIISVSDVNARKRNKTLAFDPRNVIPNKRNNEYFTEAGVFCSADAFNSVNNINTLSENINDAFSIALDVFVEICLEDSEQNIVNATNALCEWVSKVRDSEHLVNSIKYRNSRFKTKISTKINNKIKDVNDLIINHVQNLNNTIDKNVLNNREPFVQEQFDILKSKAKAVYECDRIISNYDIVSKKVNFNEFFDYYYGDNTYEITHDIVKALSESLNTNFKSLYNAALESTEIFMVNKGIDHSKESIIEAVTDYFLIRNNLSDENLNDIKSLSKNSVLYEQSDFDCISFLWESEQKKEEKDKKPKKSLKGKYLDNKNKVKKKARDFHNMVDRNFRHGNPSEYNEEEVKKMINDFRKECKESDNPNTKSSKFKSMITKLFTKSPNEIVNELPSIFTIIRASFIITVSGIYIPVGIITLITSECLKIHLNRKQLDKVIKNYKNEISNTKKKIDKIKDPKEKELYEKYLKKLQDDLGKIETYEYNLYTDKENEEKYNYDDEYDSDNDFDGDWDDDEDWDDDLEESALLTMGAIIEAGEISSIILSKPINGGVENIDGVIFDNIFKMVDNNKNDAVDFVKTIPLTDIDSFRFAISERKDVLKESKDHRGIDYLNELNYVLNETSFKDMMNIKTAIAELMIMDNLTTKDNNSLLEMDFTNTLKLAIHNMKKSTTKLSEKEKKASHEIDMAVEKVSKDMQDAMTNDNREAVIKGRLLPSASKTIKLALVSGVAWAINPAIAVIGALGTLATMKSMRTKERQLIIDDIEVEIGMCERYIQQAEGRNDLKKVREYEKIKRNLERQQQRIKYKMNVESNRNIPNSTDTPRSIDD